MKISVSQEIFKQAPQFRVGTVVIGGLTNVGEVSWPKIAISKEVLAEVGAWKQTATAFGIDVGKFPQSSQNLLERFQKDGQITRVNPLIDMCNFISLETGVPVGAHDLDRDPGDIEVRSGQKGDTYVPLNQVKKEEVIDPVVFATGSRVQTRNWTWRIADTSKIDEKSKNVVIFADTLPPLDFDQTVALLNRVAKEVVSRFGGTILAKEVLSSDNPAMEIDLARSQAKRKIDRIDEILSRGVENIIPNRSALEKALRSGKKLKIYNGIDPTATMIHVGNAFPLRKLQAFVELGHEVTFLIGDFTALIGDNSDKDSERPVLTWEQIENNFQTYKSQAEKFLDFSKVKVVHNADWLKKLTFTDIIQLCRNFSVGDFIGRELIRKRLDSGQRVRLDEVLYPVMQGYDSYHMDMDLQIGGTDQTFNMQAGRALQKMLRHKDAFVMATGFLEGTDGRKMSKSWGNAIWVEDPPEEVFGKVMSLKDELITRYFLYGTKLSLEETAVIDERLKKGENPMTIKKELAHQITLELHGKALADKAQKQFESTFQEGQVPADTPTVSVGPSLSVLDLLEVLVNQGLAKSKSEARRLVGQGGVSIIDSAKPLSIGDVIRTPSVLRVGKRQFLSLTP